MIASETWLMLVGSVSGENATARMRIWRGLKASGAGALRDGVHVLPARDGARAAMARHAEVIEAAGGTAHVIAFASADEAQEQQLRGLFDRRADYAALYAAIEAWRATLASADEAESRRQLAALRRDYAAVSAIDFFPAAEHRHVGTALADAAAALDAKYSPDEPHARTGAIMRRAKADYSGRVWATREHLWVDRVASAWLIRRFIDRKATFRWLRAPKDCPKRAVGFDFDGAEFSHVGDRVTFEVLVAAFGLDADPALARIGAIVRYLDVGGVAIAEAAGFAAAVAGARARAGDDDDAMLKAVGHVLDLLHAGIVATDAAGKREDA